MRRRRRLIGGAALVAGFLLWRPALIGVAKFMHVSTPVERADFILPLFRESTAVPAAAAALYREGLAPRVLLYRTEPNRIEALGLSPPAYDTWRRLLEARGVPSEAITPLDAVVSSEVQIGRALRALDNGSKPIRVVAVTFGPTSRLSRNALRRGLGDSRIDLRIYSATSRSFDPNRWWHTRSAWIVYFDSYCLWLRSLIR
jgi:hypothetical protein